jgi:transcription elongation factor
MTESEELVWFEADGTRHVLDEPASVPTARVPTPPRSATGDRVVDATTTTSDGSGSRRPATDAPAKEPAAEPRTDSTRTEEPPAEDAADESAEEPSALRGMMRALALGAAAAAATGAAVGAISLAATGDRPDTTDETTPPTVVTGADSSVPAPPDPTQAERVELVPPTTSADQPG